MRPWSVSDTGGSPKPGLGCSIFPFHYKALPESSLAKVLAFYNTTFYAIFSGLGSHIKSSLIMLGKGAG